MTNFTPQASPPPLALPAGVETAAEHVRHSRDVIPGFADAVKELLAQLNGGQ